MSSARTWMEENGVVSSGPVPVLTPGRGAGDGVAVPAGRSADRGLSCSGGRVS